MFETVKWASVYKPLFCLTFSHNHFEFTDPLPWFPTFCLNFIPYFLGVPAKDQAFHSLYVGGISFNLQAGIVVNLI